MIKFIDLFAGIGGFRIGFEKNGYECIFSSEINEHACKMYEKNFGINPYCDITKLDASTLPDFDVLCGGFPCQAFSAAGKKLGFKDKTRGTLFFDICRILKEKHPAAFVLENVANLEKHDNGKTFHIMLETLYSLGYTISYKVLNARDFGVPQNRERIIIIGNNQGKEFDFNKLKTNTITSMEQFLDKEKDFVYLDTDNYILLDKEYIKRQQKSGLIFCGYKKGNLRKNGVKPNTEHLSRSHKQPNRIYDMSGTHPTFSSQEKSGRYYIKTRKGVRKLTLDECYRFMGFPENFKRCGSFSNQYERIGNSVCVNMIDAIAKEMKNQFFS